jgi:enoyl reductase-like protein
METAEKQTIFESTIEMQKETLAQLIETGKKVTEMYKENNPLQFMLKATKVENVGMMNMKEIQQTLLNTATVFSKQLHTLTKLQRESVKLFTTTQKEWLQNVETKENKQWVEKFVEMNDYLEQTYVTLDENMSKSIHNGFEVYMQQVENNTFMKANW